MSAVKLATVGIFAAFCCFPAWAQSPELGLDNRFLSLEVDGQNFDEINSILGSSTPSWPPVDLQNRLFEPSMVTPEPEVRFEQRCTTLAFGVKSCTQVPRVIQQPPEIRLVPNGNTAFIDVESWENLTPEQLSTLMAVASAQIQDDFAFLVSPIDSVECQGDIDTDNWPLSSTEVMRQIAYTRSTVSRRYQAKDILILDTGYFPDLLPKHWKPNGADPAVAKAPSITASTNVVAGVNLADLSDNPLPPDGYELGWHGMSVAELALGGRGMHAFRSISDILPKVIFAGTMKDRTSGTPTRISPSSLNNAYKYADENEISVINVSFLINSEITSFREVLRQRGEEILLVVASGNDGRDLRNVNSWPAFLGGVRRSEYPGAIISVGSHDPSGSLSTFSRFNEDLVDVLAPGCDVPTLELHRDGTGEAIFRHTTTSGTSFAAPIVSFTASILSGFGLRPFEIKDRINISAETDHSLRDKVFSSGRLSTVDALAFPFTVTYLRSGALIERFLGEPHSTPSIINLCGRTFRSDRLAKISRREDAQGVIHYHIWEYGFAGAPLRHQVCDSTPQDHFSLEVQVWNEDRAITVTKDNLSDLIFQHRQN